jgi:hypothetical protein
MKSSLQRAVEVAGGSSDVATAVRKGDFENCFAGGLDLSEFGGSTSTNTSSHAALLLQVKLAESADRLQQEQDDERMQVDVRRRIEKHKEASMIRSTAESNVLQAVPPSPMPFAGQGASLELLNRSRDVGVISALVVGMHGAERNDEPRHKLKRLKANPRLKAKSLKESKQTKEKQVVKRSKRSKH